MLGRPCKAHHTSDQRVVATVRPLIGLGEQFIETMGWLRSPTLRHIDPDRTQPRRSHGDEQCRLGLPARREIIEAHTYDLVSRQVISNFRHAQILGDP